MSKVIFTKGLQGSGKSTWAKDFIKKNPTYKRVNRDDLRMMIDDIAFNPKKEKFITIQENAIIVETLKAGYNLIIDNMNLNPKTIPSYKKVIADAGVNGVEYEVKDFTHVPLSKCIENDLKRPNSLGSDVIYNTYMKYFDVREHLSYQPDNTDAPDQRRTVPCIIVDLDGTLAKMVGRSPFDWKSVGTDAVRSGIKFLVNTMYENGVRVFLFSGRDSVCKKETEDWLERHEIFYTKLAMRKEGDNRPDAIIKRELFEEHIVGNGYRVEFVVDDRPVMVRAWKEMGLTVLNVDDRLYHTEF